MTEPLSGFTFNHADQPDRLSDTMTPAEVKAAFDSRAEEVRLKVNEIINDANLGNTVYANIRNSPFLAVGDGETNDTEAIQKAIDAVYDNGGGTVVIPPDGTFIFTSLNVKANVTLKSLGGTLKLKDNTCISTDTSYYLIHNLNDGNPSHENVTLDGLIIDGNGTNNTDFTVADGITIGGENCSVKNCFIFDAPDSGIMFSGATNSLCIDNRIDTGSDVGIYVNDGSGSNAHENVIENNRITNFPNGGIALKRIYQRTTVANNQIFACGNGMTLEQGSTTTDYSKNLTIIGNRIRNVGSIGIDIRSAPYCNIIGNRVENFGNYGLSIQGDSHQVSASGNVITSDGTVSATGTTRSGILMTSRQGLFPSYCVINGNTIEITNEGTDAIIGLYLLTLEANIGGGNFNVFNGNTFKTTAPYGARITGSYSNNTYVNNVFDGTTNDFYNNGSSKNLIANNTFVNGNPLSIDASTETYVQLNGIKHVTMSTAAPTSGTWQVGDRCLNSAPTNGGVDYWECITAGTPGTWIPVQLGYLSSITAAPSYVGFKALSGGILYMAKGASSAADWVQIS